MNFAIPKSFIKRNALAAFQIKHALHYRLGLLRKAVILPPSSPGSLGDEALMMGLTNEIVKNGSSPSVLTYGSSKQWSHISGVDRGVSLRNYFKGRSWPNILPFLREASRHEYFFMLGADVLDGKYSVSRSLRRIELLNLASQVGTKVQLVGTSFNSTPDPACLKALRELPSNVALRARDEISKIRLEEQLGRPVSLTADAAFLLKPTEDAPIASELINWINTERTKSSAILGININHHHLRLVSGLSQELLIEKYVTVMTALSDNQDASFVLLPHDSRGPANDFTLSELLIKSLPRHVCHRVTMANLSVRADEIKAICGHLDFVLTGRMHVAIASLGSKTPVGAITYQGKFEGLFQHFELDGMCLSPGEMMIPGRLTQFTLDLFARRSELKRQIASKLERVMQLAQKNIEL